MARLPRQPTLITLSALSAVVVACAITSETRRDQTPVSDTLAHVVEKAPLAPVDPIRDWSTLRLADMTPEDRVRSLLLLRVPGIDPDAMRATVAPASSGGLGAAGVILMRDNVLETPHELADYTATALADPELPPIISIDEEGGDVVRLPFDSFSGADYLRTVGANETADAFASRAALLASAGINLNFGIVADVTSSSSSFIYWRTLGDDPASAAERVAAAVGAETPLVASTLKHFPGHGRTNADSHSGIPTTDVSLDEWRATDAVPFAAGIDTGAPAVMFGHLAFSSVDAAPASLSPAWHDILRTELGFTGLSVTDDMLMLQASGLPELSDPYANAIAAVSAGNDLLLYVLPTDPSTVGIDLTTLVSSIIGNVSAERIDEAALRVLMFRRALAPDARSWIPPCGLTCTAEQVGGFIPVTPVILVSETPK